MIGGHPSMAKGLGEREEATEGAVGRWGQDDRHG
jgi:hypothetical protein